MNILFLRGIACLAMAAATIAAAPAHSNESALQIPAPPDGKMFWTAEQDDFTVRVRVPGGEWQDLYEYRIRVDSDTKSLATMAFLNSDGPVEVSVKKNNGSPQRVNVRPAAKGIDARLEGDTAYFTLDGPAKISVEFDDDRLHNLHLFVGQIRKKPEDASDNLRIFGPGVHKPEEGNTFVLESGQTVYLAPGAILDGGVEISNAKGVRLLGSGLIYHAPAGGIEISNSEDVYIDGPAVINPGHYSIMCGQSNGIEIRDFRAFSEGSWTDGIDLVACSDVTIDDVFLRNSDDTIAIYAGRGRFSGDSRNYRVSNAILWADIAHPIHIGLHGTATRAELVEDIEFRNIDVLEHDENDPEYQGAIAINASDDNLVRNIRFEDIRVERIEEGVPFLFRVVFNNKYSHSPGRGISNITLRNVQFPALTGRKPVIEGFAKNREVTGIVLDNVTIGTDLLDIEGIDVREFVGPIIIK